MAAANTANVAKKKSSRQKKLDEAAAAAGQIALETTTEEAVVVRPAERAPDPKPATVDRRSPKSNDVPADPVYVCGDRFFQDMSDMIRAGREGDFDFRVGDTVKNDFPHPSRRKLPIIGKVIRVNRDSLTVNLCDEKGIVRTDGLGLPFPDFIMKAAARLLLRAKSTGTIRKVDLRSIHKQGEDVWEQVINDSTFVYVHRAHMGLDASPLANPFAQKGRSRKKAQEKFEDEILKPAIESESGPVWKEVSRLSDWVAGGQRLTVGCWCAAGEPCHASPIIKSIRVIAKARMVAANLELSELTD